MAEFNADDFLKRHGGVPTTPADIPKAAAPSGGSFDAEDFLKRHAGSDTPAEDSSWTQTIRDYTDPYPVIKGAAGGLEKAAELIPGVKGSAAANYVRDWAESGQESETAGGFKRGVGRALPYMLQPELGFSRAAAAAAPYAGRIIGSVLPTVGQLAERATTGAIAGYVEDPSKKGAITGALGGIAPTTLNTLVQNPATQYMLRQHASRLAGGAAATGLSHFLGPLGFLAYPAAVRGRVGRGINAAGHWIADGYGRVVGFIPERVSRAIAAAGGQAASQTFGGSSGEETDQAN